MGRNKPSGVKTRLLKKRRQNNPVPTWVVARTQRKVRTHPKKRMWRKRKMKIA